VARFIERQAQIRSLLKVFSSNLQWKLSKHSKSLVLEDANSNVSSASSSPESSDLDFSALREQDLDLLDTVLLKGIYTDVRSKPEAGPFSTNS